ncbi:DUF3168 domain-containing protein [Litorimonas haliclonae]|uniref:DUF3168 domain-containing protein n=1 Tax=Litorimonas haliclonae TaxID=2081977 RepID=UPI0039EF1F5D
MSQDMIAKAVHSALSQNTGVQDALGTPPRLYDSAPEDPVFPYLSYGAMRREDVGGDATPLCLHQMTLHLWSRYAGRAEILGLLAQIETVVTDQDALSAHLSPDTLVSATALYSDILRAPDGRTHHGLLRLSFLTQAL